MSVEFSSTIKMRGEGFEWFILLRDLQNGKSVECKDLDEYELKLQELSEVYGGHVDNVAWSCEDDVPPYILDEVRFAMVKFQEKYAEQLEK